MQKALEQAADADPSAEDGEMKMMPVAAVADPMDEESTLSVTSDPFKTVFVGRLASVHVL
jgi:hypothetical protein